MKILASWEIMRPYPEWRALYDAHGQARAAAGIADVFIGHEEGNTAAIHALYEVADLETFEAFIMHPDTVEAGRIAGHLMETTIVTPLVE